MSSNRRTVPFRLAFAAAVIGALVAAGLAWMARPSDASPSLGQLKSELGAQQARQQTLSGSIASLNGTISSLDGQITLVESREATVNADLTSDRAKLKQVQADLVAERAHLAEVRHRLALAKEILGDQLRSSYESSPPDLVSVVLEARGFSDLLDQLTYLGMAEHRQQATISITKMLQAEATAAVKRLAQLQVTDRKITAAAAVQARELAGMNELLQSRESALSRARSAQQAALGVSEELSHSLRHQISHIEAVQAAEAAAAAAAAAQRAADSSPVALGPVGGSGGWAIPYAIVLCESGGQDLPPNSAGASGYYQIIPSTWKLFGGTGPAAYLAPKSEQDAVAARIWNGGAGASNWVCAGIVGIH
jgi:septal ring factor EnvC (AmiA/AmiB activator)